MKQLNIIKNKNGNEAVLCSQLYRGLGLKESNYNRWVKKNITNNSFAIEGEDYTSLKRSTCTLILPNEEISNKTTSLARHNEEIRTRTTQRKQDFVLTLDFAKHLSMLCRTEKGHEIRNYFLLCEQLAKDKEKKEVQYLKNRLSIYEKMEQIREMRITFSRQMQELKTALTSSKNLYESTNN